MHAASYGFQWPWKTSGTSYKIPMSTYYDISLLASSHPLCRTEMICKLRFIHSLKDCTHVLLSFKPQPAYLLLLTTSSIATTACAQLPHHLRWTSTSLALWASGGVQRSPLPSSSSSSLFPLRQTRELSSSLVGALPPPLLLRSENI